METFVTLLRQIGQIFKWWFIVQPWELAVRTRLGQHARRLEAGVHLRIPYVDVIFVQSVRRRVMTLPTQTVMTKDRKPLTVGGTLGYGIVDVLALYQQLHHAEATLANLAAQAIAVAASAIDLASLTPIGLASATTDLIAASMQTYGIGEAQVSITDLVSVRTIRLIQDNRWNMPGEPLDSNTRHT